MTNATPTLAGSLAVVLAQAPDVLVPGELHPALLELARGLAPVHHCGFEVRLDDSGGIDFQQGGSARAGQLAALWRHLERSRAVTPQWRSVGRFVAACDDPSSELHAGIRDVWLEFDAPPKAALSVFVGFVDEPGVSDASLARAAIEQLAGAATLARWSATLDQCFAARPDGARVFHVGVMLGRAEPFLRAQVVNVEPHDLGEYVQRLGWRWDVEVPVGLAYALRPLADRLALCVDIGERLQPTLGIEALFESQPPRDRRWPAFLDQLVERGWCTPARREALLGWPGVVTPREARGAWPADLVRASLRQPADHFTSLERRLSHIKVVYEDGVATYAKAYFGYEHRWLRPGIDRDEPRSMRRVPRAGGGIAGARAAAIDFLLASRTRSGWWRDFGGTLGASAEWAAIAGWSDEWVTAFVGTALASGGTAGACRAAMRAWELLEARRAPTGGWGWNRLLPADGDSTAWGLRLARSLGVEATSRTVPARAVLESFRLPDGGIATYRDDACPRLAAPSVIPPDGSYAGWCGTSHACVTAATALLADEPALEFLRQAQRVDGSWASYWWGDDEYATGLAAEALHATQRPHDRARVSAAAAWAHARIGDDGSVASSPFATAWVVRILALGKGGSRAAERSRAWLVDRQDADGGWPASARLLSPRPDVTERAKSPIEPIACLDDARVFTTATVLPALPARGSG